MNHEGTKHAKEKKKPPARLFVLLARKAPVGVILRKGPSAWVQMIKWDTATDQFEAGQWFKGRIYERKCQLTPDGQLLIYFAHKGSNWLRDKAIGMTWTAISRPPYFTALALWPENGTWGGGGYFIDNDTVRIYVRANSAHPDHQPSGIKIIGTEDNALAVPKTPIDNNSAEWVVVQEGRDWGSDDGWLRRLDPPAIIRKQMGDYGIERYYYGYRMNEGYSYKYGFIAKSDNLTHMPEEGVTWADFDQQGRLVLARDGKLFSAVLQDGELVYTELADFNANQPEPVEAPEWARRW